MKRQKCCQLGLYEKSMPDDLSWPEKLAAARAAGFDSLEISIDESDKRLARLDWTASERLALCTIMNELDFRIESMCLSGHRRYPLGSPDPSKRALGLSIMAKAIILACDLGIRIIQIAGYDTYYDPSTASTEQLFTEGLLQSVDMAAREGVILAFETMETPFMDTVGKAMHYVRLIQSPYLQLYPDIGNLTNAALTSKTSVTGDLRLGQGHLAAVHLKETKPGIYREVSFGTGHVDFDTMISLSIELGVRRFTAEFWHLGEKDWPDRLQEAHGFLRSRLDRYSM